MRKDRALADISKTLAPNIEIGGLGGVEARGQGVLKARVSVLSECI